MAISADGTTFMKTTDVLDSGRIWNIIKLETVDAQIDNWPKLFCLGAT